MNEVLMRLVQRKKTTKEESLNLHLFKQLKQLSSSPEAYQVINPIDGGVAIEMAKLDERMRKVVARFNFRMTGKYPSRKNNRMVQWESHHELATFRILEICSYVKSYREQPARIIFCDEDKVTHIHYPDILVQLKSGLELFLEVKPERATKNNDLMQRTNLLQRLLQPRKYQYLLVFPEQIDSEAYLENAIHLLKYNNCSLPENVIEIVRRIYRDNNYMKLGSLVLSLEHESARSWIYKMLITGDLECDLSKPLNAETIINWSER